MDQVVRVGLDHDDLQPGLGPCKVPLDGSGSGLNVIELGLDQGAVVRKQVGTEGPVLFMMFSIPQVHRSLKALCAMPPICHLVM